MSQEITDTTSALTYGQRLVRGERVSLRPATDEDFATLATWWQSPDWAVLQTDAVRPQPEGDLIEKFRGWSRNDSPGAVGFSVVDTDGVFAGHAVLYGAGLPARIATYAVVLGPDFTGRGLGVDVTRLMVRYGFEEMALNKIELTVWAFNTRAIRAYEKAGFAQEGVRRQAAFHGGKFHDQVNMGMLADEYFSHSA